MRANTRECARFPPDSAPDASNRRVAPAGARMPRPHVHQPPRRPPDLSRPSAAQNCVAELPAGGGAHLASEKVRRKKEIESVLLRQAALFIFIALEHVLFFAKALFRLSGTCSRRLFWGVFTINGLSKRTSMKRLRKVKAHSEACLVLAS